MAEPQRSRSDRQPRAAPTADNPSGVGRGAGLWCLVAVGLGALLIARGTPLWWLGGALWLSAVAVAPVAYPGAFRAAREWLERPRTWRGRDVVLSAVFVETFYIAVLVYVGSVMMADLRLAERPVSHDHTVHYFKAWQLHEHLLPHGRLYGWSHRFFGGYPVNYLYPIGADLWVNLIHALGLGAFSFSRAYGVAFWLFHLLLGVAGYRFGRSVAGPHVGFIAGLLLLTDMAEFRLGGWAYTVEYGVWPQALSLAFGLLALSHMPGIMRGRALAPIGAFGLWMGFAILTHPLQLVFLGMLLVVAWAASVLAEGVHAATAMVRLLAAYALAVWVACLWLIPFMDTRSHTDPMGIWWDSTYEMAQGLLNLSSLPGTLGYVLAFGMLGLAVGLRTRRVEVLLTALLALFIPVVSSSTFVDEFRLPVLSEAFSKVQFLRMGTMVKPFWFTLAGYFLVAVLSRLPAIVRAESAAPGAASAKGSTVTSRACLALLTGLLVLPFAVPAFGVFWTRNVAKSLRTVDDRQFLDDREALRSWLLTSLPQDGFYRVGIFTGHNHDLFDLATEFNKPIFKRGFTPCTNFVYKMRTRERAVLDAVQLRFAIAKKVLPKEDFALLRSFGIYRVYRYLHYQPEPFRVLGGPSDVKLVEFSDEQIVVDAGPNATGKLWLSVSWFPRWKAYRDGQQVPISLTYVEEEEEETGFITVPLAPGRYRFVFERTLTDHLAIPIGLLGIAFALLLIFARPVGFKLPLAARAGDWLDGLGAPRHAGLRKVSLLSLCVLLLIAAVGLAEWRPAIELDAGLDAPAVRRVRYDFLESLRDAYVRIDYSDRRRGCRRMGDRFICRDREGNLDDARFVGSDPTTIEEYRMVRCIRARPEADAVLRIHYPDVPRGGALVGYYGLDFEGRLLNRRRPVDFQIRVDRERVYREQTKSDNRMHWFNVPMPSGEGAADVTFKVRARNVSKRWFCFNAQVVDF